MIVSLIFILIAGILNAIMDVLSFRFYKSIFNDIKNEKLISWINPAVSWKNKYKDKDPKKGPAFFGSMTFLVSVTDAWHCAKSLMITCLCCAIIFYESCGINIFLELGILYVAFSGVFELFYSKILINK